MEPITFDLTAADGSKHRYDITPHTHEQGHRLFWQLMATAAGPLARVADIVLATQKAGGLAQLLDKDHMDLLDEVLGAGGVASLGEDVKRAILSTDMPDIGVELLRFTNRDGQPMSEAINRDMAYQANWIEYLQALWRSVEHNNFLPLLDMLSEQLSKKPQPTETPAAGDS